METKHRVAAGDGRQLTAVADDSVALVVTSPPYPMIELWDEMFAELDPAIGDALGEGNGEEAFDRMHAVLADVWSELGRVLVDGGIACINVGDATRRLGDEFQKYGNAARTVQEMKNAGFVSLPDILWHKPSNSVAKFMGSGMLPPNAYVTLEHEFILIFRKGTTHRSFEPKADRRYEAAYFWEERNEWFTDVWTDVRGIDQTMEGIDARSRTAAFPVELPYRLINMYSVYGDTVLDPFCGTGTTTVAAMAAGRDSIGIDADEQIVDRFADRVETVPALTDELVRTRLDDHDHFVRTHRENGGTFQYEMEHYDLPVKTAQEQALKFYSIERMEANGCTYRVNHSPFDHH